jgi:hypothetical protein
MAFLDLPALFFGWRVVPAGGAPPAASTVDIYVDGAADPAQTERDRKRAGAAHRPGIRAREAGGHAWRINVFHLTGRMKSGPATAGP